VKYLILVRTSWFAALSQVALVSAPALAQPPSAQLGPRSEATIQIRVSVAPRFVASSQVSAETAGIAINVASNAPGLRYKVIALQQSSERDNGALPISIGKAPATSSTLLLIVPD
jgi:hypothetical protein